MTCRLGMILFLLIGLSAVVDAQGQSISSMTLDYELNGLKFKTSAKFKQRDAKILPSNTNLFVNRAMEEESVFILLPKSKQTLIASVEEVRTALAIALLPKEVTEYQWRPIEKPYIVSAGKFDTGGGQMMGFNGQISLLLEYHLIQFRNQQIVVGYLYVFSKGQRAAEHFRSSLGGGNGSAGDECVVIVRSITGEGELKSSPGMPPAPGPGSPPPPAPKPGSPPPPAPKKPNGN